MAVAPHLLDVTPKPMSLKFYHKQLLQLAFVLQNGSHRGEARTEASKAYLRKRLRSVPATVNFGGQTKNSPKTCTGSGAIYPVSKAQNIRRGLV